MPWRRAFTNKNTLKMKFNILFAVSLLLTLPGILHAQYSTMEQWETLPRQLISKDSISHDGFTLIMANDDPAFNVATIKRIEALFFIIYPAEVSTFNPNAPKKVVLFIDTAFNTIAASAGHTTHINPPWLRQNPEDIDLVTHELMHLVQGYPNSHGTSPWLTEGIADYARYVFGINNGPANWAVPDYNSSQHYYDSYRVTARFLGWLEAHGYKGIVKKLDTAMREDTYNDDTWKKVTGKYVDELWREYAANQRSKNIRDPSKDDNHY
ncbi:basic secretory protein-like protein [Mucilaginibacter sp.]|uniref:basic secretory protein-like protein n=1 Tax=Mucilaginibacter sp. TaxID=1882438 RepID=UPI002840A08D|nr:basic secretory protein-like protein [Mucilaginibacter sp.]MDR3696481.1 basic secretory protein-like protein [Mucilaginibacter sp.]